MKKKYITPVSEEMVLKYQYSLLTGSLLDINGEADIVDDGDIIDVGGVLDPDSHAFDLEDESFSLFE